MKASFAKLFALFALISGTTALNLVLSNDDGWAVAQIRDEYNQLIAAGHEVILSAPADNKSGTGRNTTTPTPLTQPCEFDTCPVGAPAIGTDPQDGNIHYVNGFPGDSVRFGIQEFAQARWGANPDFVVAGTNIGNNLGNIVKISGTVGAACEAVKEGVPSVAFSGASGDFVSYTTLESKPHARSTTDVKIQTSLMLKFLAIYLSNSTSPIPSTSSININFSSTSSCKHDARNYKWVATKVFPTAEGVDTERCGSKNLPDETTLSESGCFATVSVMNATTEENAPAAQQKEVFDRLGSLLTCL